MTLHNVPPSLRGWSTAPVLIVPLIFTAVVLAWANTGNAPFVFDDTSSIVENQSIRDLGSLSWLNPPHAAGETVSGRPVLNLSFALNYAMGGLNVHGYRVVNVLIHACAALVLFGVVRRTWLLACWRRSPGLGEHEPERMNSTGSGSQLRGSGRAEAPPPKPGNETWSGARAGLPFALGISLLWALHPLQTSAVTYVVQRAESLAGLFYLLAVYGFIRAIAPVDGRTARSSLAPRTGWSVLTMLACLGGILTKETVASAPLLVLLYDRAFVAGSLRAAWRARWRLHLALASTWLVLGALVLANGGRGGSAGFGAAIDPWTYLLTQCEAIVRYLALVIWPHGQVFDYGVATVPGLTAVWPQALLLVALASTGAWLLYRNRSAGFLVAAFFLLLAPSSSFIPIATQTMAEHRMYLPSAAVIGLLGCGGLAVVRHWPQLASSWLLLPVVTALALASAIATHARNRVYATDLTLWQDTVEKRPANPRAHHNFGLALAAAGRTDEAIAEFRRAIELQPNHAFAHAALAEALLAAGKAEEAIQYLRSALAADPGYAAARMNLGRALGSLGRTDEALAEYEAVLAAEPEAIDARISVAALLIARGETERAVVMLRAVIASAPHLAEAHYHLGIALDRMQQPDEAETALRDAVRQKSGFAGAWLALANVQARRGSGAEAEKAYREALRLDARLAEAHYGLGNVLAQRRDLPAAIEAFAAALALDPAHVAARNNLGNCQLVTGRTREAIATYEESLRLRPDDPAVQRNLALAREILRQQQPGG